MWVGVWGGAGELEGLAQEATRAQGLDLGSQGPCLPLPL